MKKTIFLLAALLFLQGCVGSVANIVEDASRQYVYSSSIFNPSSQLQIESINLSEVNYTCKALYCVNSTSGSWLFADTSLVGGNCSITTFDPNEEAEVIDFVDTIVNNESVWLRGLGIGQGPSYADFNDALPFCANSLNYVVQFLESEGDSYSIAPIERMRSACALSANVIPVYALYSHDRDATGRGVPKVNMGDLSGQLAGVGPVVLISDTAPKKDSTTYEKIKQQIAVLKGACQECMVFLAITLDEVYGKELDMLRARNLNVKQTEERYYLEKLKNDPTLKNLVDGIAFGIDSRFSEECGGRKIFVNEAIPLINYINAEFGLPSFIYYVYLPDTPECKYGDSDYVDVYDSFFLSARGLASSGLVGFAPQPFYEETSPFPCDGCAFTKKEGGQRKEVQRRFGEFFSRCEKYYKENVPPANVWGYDGYVCQVAPLLSTAYRVREPTVSEVYSFQLSSPPPRFFKCAACIYTQEPKEGINSLSSSYAGLSCSDTSDIYAKADLLGVDGVVARATATSASGNDRCFVSYSKTAGIPYDKVRDAYQDAGCGVLTPRFGSDCSSSTPTRQGETACKVSSIGVFGFSYAPGKAYTSLPREVERCGGVDFNPFLTEDAVCIFAQEFKKAVNDAKATSYSMSLGPNDEDSEVLALLIAGEIRGNVASLASTYSEIVNAGRNCDAMGASAKNLCCTYDSEKGEYRFADSTGACSADSFGEFVSKVDGNTLFSDVQPSIENMKAYASFYISCEDCYASEWLDNLCDEARDRNIFIRGCP